MSGRRIRVSKRETPTVEKKQRFKKRDDVHHNKVNQANNEQERAGTDVERWTGQDRTEGNRHADTDGAADRGRRERWRNEERLRHFASSCAPDPSSKVSSTEKCSTFSAEMPPLGVASGWQMLTSDVREKRSLDALEWPSETSSFHLLTPAAGASPGLQQLATGQAPGASS